MPQYKGKIFKIHSKEIQFKYIQVIQVEEITLTKVKIRLIKQTKANLDEFKAFKVIPLVLNQI